jgi:hypothetical protein
MENIYKQCIILFISENGIYFELLKTKWFFLKTRIGYHLNMISKWKQKVGTQHFYRVDGKTICHNSLPFYNVKSKTMDLGPYCASLAWAKIPLSGSKFISV